MTIDTLTGTPVSRELICNYFQNLVNLFFKILPMREENEPSLVVYMESLQMELLGCKSLVAELKNDPAYLSLLSVLQYLIDNPTYSTHKVKREVFRAISICNKLKAKYSAYEVM